MERLISKDGWNEVLAQGSDAFNNWLKSAASCDDEDEDDEATLERNQFSIPQNNEFFSPFQASRPRGSSTSQMQKPSPLQKIE